jgi:hypothetical protein
VLLFSCVVEVIICIDWAVFAGTGSEGVRE